MPIVNIHEAKTQLSKLVDLAAKGEPFIIAPTLESIRALCAKASWTMDMWSCQ